MRIIIPLVVFLSLLIFPSNTLANSAGPNPIFTISNELPICVRVKNPEKIDHYRNFANLIIDYSPTDESIPVKNWEIIKDGQCYELGPNHVSVYLLSGDQEINESSLFGLDTNSGFFESTRLWQVYPTDSQYFSDIYVDQIIPTQYYLIYSYGNFNLSEVSEVNDPSESYQKLYDDQEFIEAWDLSTFIAEGLRAEIQKCDGRTGIEYEVSPQKGDSWNPSYPFSNKKTIWKFADREDFSYQDGYNIDSQKVIDTIGCKSTLVTFIKDHQSDFQKYDELIISLQSRYPQEMQMVGKRYPEEYNKLLDFIGSDLPHAKEEPRAQRTTPEVTEPKDLSPEEKYKVFTETSDPLLILYFMLPFISALIIMHFIIYRVRTFIQERRKK